MNEKYNWRDHLFNFLAVILGVYLAFFINEKAKTIAEKNESRVLMKSLVADLSADIDTYEAYHIPINTENKENVDTLLYLLLANNLSKANSALAAIIQLENYSPNTSTYSSMKASGKIGLIEDLTLQKKLSDYYEGVVIESIRKGEFQVDFFTNEILDWFINNADLTKMEILNTKELIVLSNKLLIYGSLIEQKVKSYEMIVEESKQLIDLLEVSLAGG